MKRSVLILGVLLAALAGCSNDPAGPETGDLMVIGVVDTEGVPVPGIRVSTLNHSDYMRRPLPPPQALPSTPISFSLPAESRVSLRVYDYYGRLVDVLIDDALYQAGVFQVEWDTDSLRPGFYRYEILTDFGASEKWAVIDWGWAPTQAVFDTTDQSGLVVTNDTLLFPCLLGNPPPIIVTDEYGSIVDTTADYYLDTITVALSHPDYAGRFLYFDRAVARQPNEFMLVWDTTGLGR